jgi:hypothetical protein
MNGVYGRRGTKAWRLREWFHAAILRHEAAGTVPTTPKFLIYEAVSDQVISKEATGARRYDQDSSGAITWLREQGLVPWEWIVDRTRHIANHLGWSSVLEATRAVAERARLDPWRGRAPLLVVESESLAGLLEPLAEHYRIVLVPVRGQAGGARRLPRGDVDVVLHVERPSGRARRGRREARRDPVTAPGRYSRTPRRNCGSRQFHTRAGAVSMSTGRAFHWSECWLTAPR